MLTVSAALDALKQQVRLNPRIQTLSLDEALGYTLASAVISSLAVPDFDNSAMDGYVLAVDDINKLDSYTLVQRIAAGETGRALMAGEAARIFTGAPIPPGGNTVVMQEDCTVVEGCLQIQGRLTLGQHIRRRGEDVQAGREILPAGCWLGAAELGLLAAIGVAHVAVRAPLRVALLSTGKELVEPGQPLGAGQIYNSNRYAIGALLREAGCSVSDFGIVADMLADTRAALQAAAQDHDVVVSSGGVSVGEEDHVKAAVSELGELALWKIAMKPGKPFAFGRIGEADFIGLPGNPVSSFVTFQLLVQPFLAARQGGQYQALWLELPAGFSLAKAGQRDEYLRVRIENNALQPYTNQSSAVLTSAVWADGLALLPAGQTVKPGDVLRYWPLRGWRSV
ncbi:gephyrin-like molybdotransferase Glp [Chitinibacter tainanensis]|uniref:molybdopterin molybdotransferase MoeA n=1 Tax=Chitinibacter tainanensis TaxID=230667 RepID=UPI0023577CA4|nr:gephyrin-like molybdotransferase Glp [Chitinibacter tainanensis]